MSAVSSSWPSAYPELVDAKASTSKPALRGNDDTARSSTVDVASARRPAGELVPCCASTHRTPCSTVLETWTRTDVGAMVVSSASGPAAV